MSGAAVPSRKARPLHAAGERFGQDGYRYASTLKRTGAETEIELTVTTTSLGAIAKLERVLSNMDEGTGARQSLALRAQAPACRLSHARGGTFAYSDELAAKRRQLGEIETSLAESVEG